MRDMLAVRTATAAMVLSATAAVGVLWAAVRLPTLAVGDPAGTVAVGPAVIGMLLLTATGVLVVRNVHRSPIGWLLVSTGTASVAAPFAIAMAALAHDADHGAVGLLGWVTNWVWIPGQALAMLLLLRFPDGALKGRHWRPVQWVIVGWALLVAAVTAVYPGEFGVGFLAPRTNPLGLAGLADLLEPTLSAMFAVQPLLIVIVVIAPFSRWRTAPTARRRQLRAVAIAVLAVGLATPLAFLTDAGRVLEALAWLVLAGAIAYAIARHDLFDLDIRQRFDRLRRVRNEERLRLQRDLHDSLGPLLGSIGMRAEAARNMAVDAGQLGKLDEVLVSISNDAANAMVEVRRFIDELAPSALADADLPTALRELVDRQESVATQLHIAENVPELEPAAEVALYRVAAEALRNVARHARARACTVRLTLVQDGVELTVTDDGVGLHGSDAGVGRRSMADRMAAVGGTFEIGEPEDGGVTVCATVRKGSA